MYVRIKQYNSSVIVLFLVMLKIESRASYMSVKCSTTELYPRHTIHFHLTSVFSLLAELKPEQSTHQASATEHHSSSSGISFGCSHD